MYQTMNLGVMTTPVMANCHDPRWPFFACDNGCFAEARGKPFNLDRFLAWLDKHPRNDCLFAAAPDIPDDWASTVERSTPVVPLIHQLGFPAALVIQPGVTLDNIPWDDCDAVFIGGLEDAFKYSTLVASLVNEAKRRGKWAHMGRVNGGGRLRWADLIGADSADGTLVGFGPDKNLPRVAGWFRHLNTQPALNLTWGTQ